MEYFWAYFQAAIFSKIFIFTFLFMPPITAHLKPVRQYAKELNVSMHTLFQLNAEGKQPMEIINGKFYIDTKKYPLPIKPDMMITKIEVPVKINKMKNKTPVKKYVRILTDEESTRYAAARKLKYEQTYIKLTLEEKRARREQRILEGVGKPPKKQVLKIKSVLLNKPFVHIKHINIAFIKPVKLFGKKLRKPTTPRDLNRFKNPYNYKKLSQRKIKESFETETPDEKRERLERNGKGLQHYICTL